MFEITFHFTDGFGGSSATFIGKSITNGLDGFVGVEYEIDDATKSKWFNKDYVKEIDSERVDE